MDKHLHPMLFIAGPLTTCRAPIANVLLGHGEGGSDVDYGHKKFSTAKRKQWIDKIASL